MKTLYAFKTKDGYKVVENHHFTLKDRNELIQHLRKNGYKVKSHEGEEFYFLAQ